MNLAKKLTAVLLAVAMIFALSACSLTEDDSDILDIGTINIGVILSGDIDDDSTLSNKIYGAFTSACNSAGAGDHQINEQTKVKPGDTAAMDKAMTDIIARGCRLIVGTDGGYYTDFEKYAKENTNIFFVLLTDYDAADSDIENLTVFHMNTFESDYILGTMAAQSSASGKIGYVADADSAVSKADVNAFLLGAQSVNPAAAVSLVSVEDSENGYPAAVKTLTDAGCDVLYTKNYEIGEGDEKESCFVTPDSVANERCLVKLVDSKLEFVSAAHINYETAFTKIVTDTVNEKFAGLTGYSAGVKDGAVDVRPADDAKLSEKANQIKNDLYNGKNILGDKNAKDLCASYLNGITEL